MAWSRGIDDARTLGVGHARPQRFYRKHRQHRACGRCGGGLPAPPPWLPGSRQYSQTFRIFRSSIDAGTTEVSAYPPSPRGTARTSQMLPGRHPTPDPLRIVGRTGSPLVAPRKCAEPICQPRDADYYRDHTKVLFISCLRRASWPIESSQILTNSSL
jgi:hypothetical protein